MLQHDFYPCCGIDHPPNEGRGEKCKTAGLFVAMQHTAAGRKQARPAVSRGTNQGFYTFILYTPKSEWQAAKRLHISRKTFQSFHTCTVYDHDIMKNGKFHTTSIPICLNKTVSITFTTISIYVEALMTRSHVLNGIIKWCNKIRIKMASSVTTLFPQLIRVLQFSNWLYGISCLQTPSTSNLYFHTYTHTHNKYISPW